MSSFLSGGMVFVLGAVLYVLDWRFSSLVLHEFGIHSCDSGSSVVYISSSGIMQFVALMVCVMESWISASRMYVSAGVSLGSISVDCKVLMIASLFCGEFFSM